MATQDPTVNYSWALPDVGGDDGAWGGMLNTIIGDDALGIDAVIGDLESRLAAAEAALGTNPTEAVVNRFVTVTSGVVANPANILTALLVRFAGTTNSSTGAIVVDLDDVTAAGGPELDSGDFLLHTFDGFRNSDQVMVQAPAFSLGTNTVTFTIRYRDGALALGANITANIVLYFSAAPA